MTTEEKEKLAYRESVHKILAKKYKAKRFGGWTKENADHVFDEDYWEDYRKEEYEPEEALEIDSSYWEE